MVLDQRKDLIASGSLLRRERDDRNLLRQQQGLPDGIQIACKLAFFDLVQLIRQHDEGLSGREKAIGHGLIVRGRLVADIDDLDTQRDQAGGKIGLEQRGPAVTLALGNLGVAVAGQIDEICLLVDRKEVDMDGLAGLSAHAGEIAAV